MPTPSPRTPVLPARGFYAVIEALSADIQEGELVYIKDQNTLYVKEAGALVPILGAGSVATNSVRAGDNVSKLANDVGYITLSDVPEDRVLSVNGELGSVVLDADDIPTAGTINKFTTQDDINKLAGIQPGAEINEVNEAPLDGSIYSRQNGSWVAPDYAVVSRFFSLINTPASANTTGTVTLPKAGMALKVYTSKAGWFRLYNTVAARTADAGRTQGTDPAPGSGVLFETLTAAGETLILTPVPLFANMESPVSNSYPWAFSNTTDSASASIEIWYLSVQA